MAIDFSQTQITKLAIHRVGNKSNDEGYFLSKQVTDIRDTEAHRLLIQFFTGVFKNPEFFQFTHPTQMEQNDVYQITQQAFSNKPDFLNLSGDVAKLLYSKSTHPQVKGGELYVVLFQDILLENEMVNAIGIFKSESKTPFMRVLHKGEAYDYEFDQGIDLHAIDKACIVLNTKEEDGYRACLNDRQNKGEEALYWKHEFLGLKPSADDYHKTKQFMSLAKSYIKDRLPQEFEVEKTDQIEMMNKSAEFFKKHEQFDYQSFSREVIQEPHIMQSFSRFKEEFEERNEFEIGDGFNINTSAVKSQSRFFKSVLKLDRNFHVYVHGNKEMIEKGYDEERNLNYYKLFYREES